MSAITIRNLDPEVKYRIRQLAHIHGRSMEGQVRLMLTMAVGAGVNDTERLATQGRLEELQRENVLAMVRAVKRLEEIRARKAAQKAAAVERSSDIVKAQPKL